MTIHFENDLWWSWNGRRLSKCNNNISMDNISELGPNLPLKNAEIDENFEMVTASLTSLL